MAVVGREALVIGVASSALFDLAESHAVLEEQGEDAYRAFQEQNHDVQLRPGIAFTFIKRLLALNDLTEPADPTVEVIVLSRNDPETGARVMRSIETHALPITRAVFMQGRSPYKFMPAFRMKLFLSASPKDVAEAVELGYPAGQVVGSAMSLAADDPEDHDLRVALTSMRFWRTTPLSGCSTQRGSRASVSMRSSRKRFLYHRDRCATYWAPSTGSRT